MIFTLNLSEHTQNLCFLCHKDRPFTAVARKYKQIVQKMSKSFKKIRYEKKKAEKSFCLENSTFHALSKNIDQAFQVSPLMMTVETLFTSSLKKITDFCSNYLSR